MTFILYCSLWLFYNVNGLYVRHKNKPYYILADHALVLSFYDGKKAKNMREALMTTLHVQTQCTILL